MKNIAIFTIFFPLAIALFHRCPQPDVLSERCACHKRGDVTIKCRNVRTDYEMAAILQPLSMYFVDNLIIKNSGPFNFVSKPFHNLHIKCLTFEEVHFNVLSIFSSLHGVEFTLEELRFIKCQVHSWQWTKGFVFSSLKTVRFENTSLPKLLSNNITAVFPKNIRKLQIVGCSIKKLGNQALRKFPHLEELELDRNRLTTLKRSMLPEPARRLKSISLNKNKIWELPTNFFNRMRRLEFLYLEGTQFKVLPEELFQPVWEQLQEVSFNSIELPCDCKTTWLLSRNKERAIQFPTCSSPIGDKNHSLKFYSYSAICP